jgi:lauroyl/myristoyl acyltransferase
LTAAPHLGRPVVDVLAGMLARIGPYAPVLARTVARNMQALGVYTPDGHRAYFGNVAAHLAAGLHVMRLARQPGESEARRAFKAYVDAHVDFDASVSILHDAVAAGRGVVVVCPHIVNYVLNVPRLGGEIPLAIYMRHSRDPAQRDLKRRWCDLSGTQPIMEAARSECPARRLDLIAQSLREGRAVLLTPDMPRKRDDGVAVRFFKREVYLPPGGFVLAQRTGAPLVMVSARFHLNRQILSCRGPIHVPAHPDDRDAARAAIQASAQWYGDNLADFIRAEPALWFFWGDKRWTRIFHNDPRYTRPVTATSSTDRPGNDPVPKAV